MYIELTRDDDGQKFLIDPSNFTINDGEEGGAFLMHVLDVDRCISVEEGYHEIKRLIKYRKSER